MKFFKHFTDSNRGRSMQAILGTLGHTGHSAWWILVELCAEKMHKRKDEEYDEEHCRFVFNERFLRDNLRLSGAKVVACLNQYQTLALLSFKITGPEIHVHMPKLLESLDRDAKRARAERGQSAPKRESKRKREEREDSRAQENFKTIFATLPLTTQTELLARYGKEYLEEHGSAAVEYFSAQAASASWSGMFWGVKIASWLKREVAGEKKAKAAGETYSAFNGVAE